MLKYLTLCILENICGRFGNFWGGGGVVVDFFFFFFGIFEQSEKHFCGQQQRLPIRMPGETFLLMV